MGGWLAAWGATLYSDVHDQLLPPFQKNIISLRYAGSRAIVANAHAWLQELYFWQTSRPAFLRSVVIFVKYRKGFHPYDITKFRRPLKRQRCIRVLATTIRGGVRPQFNSPGRLRRFSRPTKAILQGNQKGPCVRSLQTVGGELAYRSEIIFF